MKSDKRKSFSFFLILGIIIIIICLDLLGIFGMLKVLIAGNTAKTADSFSYIKNGLNDGIKIFKSVSKLNEENNNLLEKNRSLISTETKIKEIEKENQDLKNALNISNLKEEKKQPVNIFSNLIKGTQGTFYVDKGSKDGLEKNQVVIDSNGFFIGKLIKIEKNWAEGIFATHMPSELPVKIAGKKIEGLVNISAKGWTLDMVQKNSNLKEEDIVLLKGDKNILSIGTGNINIIVGRVRNINQDEKEIFITSEVEPLVKFQETDFGFVLTSN